MEQTLELHRLKVTAVKQCNGLLPSLRNLQ